MTPRHGAPLRVDVRILDERVRSALPAYATEGSAGMDLRACIEAPLTLHVGKASGGKQDTAQTKSGQTATAQADTAQATTVSPRWSAQALRFCPWLG